MIQERETRGVVCLWKFDDGVWHSKGGNAKAHGGSDTCYVVSESA